MTTRTGERWAPAGKHPAGAFSYGGRDMTDTAADRPIRTFHPRRGRMSTRHAEAMARLWPAYGLTVVDGDRTPLDLDALFGRVAPRVLEIGFGMGEATAHIAALMPERNFLCCEVHDPGVGALLLEELLQEADRRRQRVVSLEVRADNGVAQRLYARHGFARVGVRRGYYRGGVDAWTLTRRS